MQAENLHDKKSSQITMQNEATPADKKSDVWLHFEKNKEKVKVKSKYSEEFIEREKTTSVTCKLCKTKLV